MTASEQPRSATRSRAGNAMGRTRAAVLAGARACLARDGARRTTMLDIAAAAGVAKATLYNHFRTRAEVYRALAQDELAGLLDTLTTGAAAHGGPSALVAAAAAVAAHPVLAALRREDPAELARLLLALTGEEPLWTGACAAVDGALGPGRGEPALRWLASFCWQPGGDPTAGAALLAGDPAAAALAVGLSPDGVQGGREWPVSSSA